MTQQYVEQRKQYINSQLDELYESGAKDSTTQARIINLEQELTDLMMYDIIFTAKKQMSS